MKGKIEKLEEERIFLVRRVELAKHFIRTNIEPKWTFIKTYFIMDGFSFGKCRNILLFEIIIFDIIFYLLY